MFALWTVVSTDSGSGHESLGNLIFKDSTTTTMMSCRHVLFLSHPQSSVKAAMTQSGLESRLMESADAAVELMQSWN